MTTIKLTNADSMIEIENNTATRISRAERMEAIVENARKTLEASGVWAEVWADNDLPMIHVEISWGDWKHDHLRADWALAKEGLTCIGETVTEEDGSDTYSAIHNYVF